MGNIFMYLAPILICVILLYSFFIVPKVIHNTEAEFLKVEDALIGKEKVFFLKYLSEDNGFKPISKVFLDKEIIGFTACMKHKTGKQIASQLVINTTKSLIESIIRKFMIRVLGYHGGHQFSRGDKGSFYLVATNKALHYLFFSDGKLVKHQQFYFNEIKDFIKGKAGVKDVILKGGVYKYPKISFKTKMESHTFFYVENIEYYPSKEPLEKQAAIEVAHLFVTPFKNKIAQL